MPAYILLGNLCYVARWCRPVRGQVWLDIHDMGPGIPPERAETIFERFRTTRPGGLGLGLSIVRGFMEAQRGAVSLVPAFRRNMFPACPSPGGAR